MVLTFCLSPKEFSFAMGPRGCCGGEWWLDVGIERGKLLSLGFHERLHAWLRIGRWANLSWVWRKPRQPLDVGWGLEVPEVLREAMRQSIIRELALHSPFAQFLRKPPVVSWVVVHGEVVKVEEAPPAPETRGEWDYGDQITVTGFAPIGVWTGAPAWNWHLEEEAGSIGPGLRDEAIRRLQAGVNAELEGEIARSFRATWPHMAEMQAVAEPPLSFCADCPGRFRPQDLFIGKKSGTPLCEGCLDRRVARGAAKKPGEF